MLLWFLSQHKICFSRAPVKLSLVKIKKKTFIISESRSIDISKVWMSAVKWWRPANLNSTCDVIYVCEAGFSMVAVIKGKYWWKSTWNKKWRWLYSDWAWFEMCCERKLTVLLITIYLLYDMIVQNMFFNTYLFVNLKCVSFIQSNRTTANH